MSGRSWGLVAATLLIACAWSKGSDRVAEARAANRDACGNDLSGEELPFSTLSVIDVAPIYSHVIGGPNGAEERLQGARMRVRARDGLTPEWATRALRCRAARVVLSQTTVAADDPFVLPDAWVDIEVRSESGALLVELRAEDATHANQILTRARAFVHATG